MAKFSNILLAMYDFMCVHAYAHVCVCVCIYMYICTYSTTMRKMKLLFVKSCECSDPIYNATELITCAKIKQMHHVLVGYVQQ